MILGRLYVRTYQHVITRSFQMVFLAGLYVFLSSVFQKDVCKGAKRINCAEDFFIGILTVLKASIYT